MLEIEGGTREWCMMILRHEAGHALENAYRLRRRPKRQALFGRSSEPYPDSYAPKPHSRSFVLHLDSWYAQSHPDEDFAETFAVWLTPGSDWRERYAGWPALRKLEYVDELMREIAGRPPAVTTRRTPFSLASLRRTLRVHYRRKRRHYRVDARDFHDRDLRALFSDAPGARRQPARGPLPQPDPARRAPAGPALDGRAPLRDRPGARGHVDALRRARAAPGRPGGRGAARVHDAAHRAHDDAPAARAPPGPAVSPEQAKEARRKLRVLALVHESLVPPDGADEQAAAGAEWKTEYDVATRAAWPRPRGAGPGHRRRPGAAARRDPGLEAPRRVQPGRGLRRRPDLGRERRGLPGAAEGALHRLQLARARARARQGARQEGALLPPHAAGRLRGLPRGADRAAPSSPALPADREVRDARRLDRHLAGLRGRGRRQARGARALHPRGDRHRRARRGVRRGARALRGDPRRQAPRGAADLGAVLRRHARGVAPDRHRAPEVEPHLPQEARDRERAGARAAGPGGRAHPRDLQARLPQPDAERLRAHRPAPARGRRAVRHGSQPQPAALRRRGLRRVGQAPRASATRLSSSGSWTSAFVSSPRASAEAQQPSFLFFGPPPVVPAGSVGTATLAGAAGRAIGCGSLPGAAARRGWPPK